MKRVRVAATALLTLALSVDAIASAMAQSPAEAAPPVMQPIAKPSPRNSAATQPPPVPATAARLEPDIAYGAYQRGYYVTAFAEATRRVEQLKDVKAMTLLGELYANGFGIKHDDNKAGEWYRIAAERGDREAMFALAMLHFSGRIKGASREDGAKLLAAAAKLGHAAAAYDLGLLYLEGQLFPQDLARVAELFRGAAQAGSPEAQYALATLYKEGRGVPKDVVEAARLLAAASSAVQRDRCGQERTAGGDPVGEGGAQGQPGGAKPSRQHSRGRARRAGQSCASHQVAHHRQSRRCERRPARRIRAAAAPGHPHRR
jgi:TPR repeat protein